MLLKNLHFYDSNSIQTKSYRAFCLNLNKIYTFQSNDDIDRPWFEK